MTATIGAALAIAVLPPTSAEALSYRSSSTVQVPVGEIVTQQVKCPKGKHVLSGGQYIFSGLNTVRLTRSRPFDSGDAGSAPDDGWRVSAAGFAPTGGELTVNAICDAKQPRYRSARAKGSGSLIEGAKTRFGKIKCPKGTRVVGGGGSIAGGWNSGGSLSHLNPFPAPEERPNKGWEIGALDYIGGPGSFPPNKAHVDAICSTRRPVYATGEATAPPNSYGEAYAECPAGTDLLGGGLWAVHAPRNFMTISTFFDGTDPDLVPDDGWGVEIDNTDSTFSFLVRAYAICAP